MSPDWDGVRGISIDIEEGFVSAAHSQYRIGITQQMKLTRGDIVESNPLGGASCLGSQVHQGSLEVVKTCGSEQAFVRGRAGD